MSTTMSNLNSSAVNEKVYWDDLALGQQFNFGEYYVSEEEIIDFALRYDPMEFHTDPKKAKLSPIGVLCASGIHTIGIMQRLTYDNIYKNWHMVAGKELSSCRFIRPVMPNDTLAVTMIVKDIHQGNRSDRGLINLAFSLTNSHQQVVLEVEGLIVMLKRSLL